jgi:hypothetical protein
MQKKQGPTEIESVTKSNFIESLRSAAITSAVNTSWDASAESLYH